MAIHTVNYKGLTLVSSDGINPDATLFGEGGTLIQDNFIYLADGIESFGPAGATVGQVNAVSGYALNNDGMISGYSDVKFDTILNANSVSGFLYGRINTVSGFLYSRIDTVSGYLQSHVGGGGITQAQLDSVSGYSVVRIGAVSGYNDVKFDTITNASNVSGYLSTVIINVSGYSNNQFNTISNASSVSGYLASRIVSISGYSDVKFDTITNSSNISGYLYGRIATVSGYDAVQYDTITNASNVSGYLYGRIATVSGYNNTQFDTITNASNVSGYLYGRIATVSGYDSGQYDTIINAINVSGYLAARIISTSGYNDNKFDTITNMTSVSGYLYGRVATVSGYNETVYDKRSRVDSISGYLLYKDSIVSGYNIVDSSQITQSSNLLGSIDNSSSGYVFPLSKLYRSLQAMGSAPSGSFASVSGLTNNPPVLNRQRRVHFAAPESYSTTVQEQFEQNLNGSDADNMWSANHAGNFGTFYVSGHKFIYNSNAAGSQEWYSTYSPLRVPFAVSQIQIQDHNGVGSFTDLGVGFIIPGGFQAVEAIYRKSSSNSSGVLFLKYEGTGVAGGFHEETHLNLSTPLSSGTWLKCVLNQGSVSLVIDEGFGEKQLQNMELGADFPNTLLTSVINSLYPSWYMGASTGGQVSSISSFECHGLGPLAYRETYCVTDPYGKPLQNERSNYYLTTDSCGPNSLDYNSNINTYDRNHMTTVLYNPETYRIVEEIGSIYQTNSTQTYGAQNSKIMYDASTGLYNYYLSDWVGTRGSNCTVLYGNTSDNILYGINILPPNSGLIDLASSLPFPSGYGPSNGSVYDPDVIKYGPDWYFCCTDQSHAYRPFLFKGTNPYTFNTYVGGDLSGAASGVAVGEGTRFAVIGGVPKVICSKPAQGGLIIYDLNMNVQRTMTIAGGDSAGFPDQKNIIPVQKNGKTTFQITGFEGEWYTDSMGQKQGLAFGHLLVLNGGTFNGLEFSTNTG